MNILRFFNKLNGRNSETYAERIQARNYSVKTFCIECPILPLVLESLVYCTAAHRKWLFTSWVTKSSAHISVSVMSLTISIANYTYIIDNFGKIIIQMDLNGSIIISGNVLMNIDGIRNIFMAIQALHEEAQYIFMAI